MRSPEAGAPIGVDELPADLRLDGTARELGYRFPAEWEPLEAVWLVRPHNPETWPGCLDLAQVEWDAFRGRLAEVVEVRETGDLGIPTNDSWIRDFGPVFLTHPQRGVAGQAFRFNGWGGKYETRSLDDAVPIEIARRFEIPLWVQPLVLEGGSIETDGLGTLLVTRQCLGHGNRNPDLDEAQIEAALRELLCVERILWLPGGIAGDDTDGHIDDIARFVRPGVVAAVEAPSGHPDHEILAQNLEVLRAARDARDERIEVVPLPAPEPIHYDFPPDRFGPGGRQILPASHANFLIANGRIFVPVFGSRSDDRACRILEEASGLEAVAVMARHLVVGLGSLHCLSCQQPADPRLRAERSADR
jgi:agmatine deiminase